jgi:hypothetical protein
MNLFLFYSNLILLSFFPLITIIVSGGAMEVFCIRFLGSDTRTELRLARIVAFGFIWTLFCFGVALWFFYKGFVPTATWSLIYATVTLGLAWVSIKISPWRRIFNSQFAIYLALILGGAFLFQVISVIGFPHVMDSTQLGWTNRFTDPLSINYGVMNGAAGYSGMIFFTGLLAPHMPLAVSAAATKIVLYFLLGVLCVSISRVFYGKNFVIGLLFSGCILVGSSFGMLLFAYGKDSLLGVLFALLYFTRLADDDSPDSYRTAALLCGAAGFTGVITVPYMALAAGLVFLLITDFKRKLEFAGSHLLIAGPLLAFPLMGMAKLPYAPVALVMFISGFFVLLIAKLKIWNKIRLPKIPFWMPAIAIIASLIASMKFLPVVVLLLDGTTPIMPPLDGKTGFIGLLYEYNSSSGIIANIYLLAPFAALWFWRNKSAESGVAFFFLPLALALYLFICNTSQHILTGSNQWDLVKNSIGYFLPPIAAMSLGPIVAQFPSGWDATKGFVPFLGLVMVGSFIQSVLVFHSKIGILNPFVRCGVIQQARSGSETAYIADYLWRKNRKMTMLIDSRCGVSPFGNLQYLSPRVEMPVVDNIITELQKYADNPPLLLIDSSREGEIVRAANLKVVDTFSIPGKNLMIIEFSR